MSQKYIIKPWTRHNNTHNNNVPKTHETGNHAHTIKTNTNTKPTQAKHIKRNPTKLNTQLYDYIYNIQEQNTIITHNNYTNAKHIYLNT